MSLDGGTVVPGYVDLQVNGVADVDFSRADGDDWVRAGRILLAAGTVGYLATICSMPLDRYDDALTRVEAAVAAQGDDVAHVLGVHLEGPFLGGALGAHPAEVVRPMELEWLSGLLDRHPGVVRLVTLAPEADPEHAGIRMLTARGVVVALGHTTCTYEEAVAAAEAGATLTTHLFNGMGPLHQRAPGIIGAALDPRVPLTPTLIGDLVHVHGALVATVFAAARPVLVSDAVATGVPYFDADVTAAAGAAYLPDGTLTGAVSLLDDAVRNAVGVGVSPTSALVAASTRPVAILGLDTAPGLIGLDDELRVRSVSRAGRTVHRSDA
jgi:N-acetylglucosamine-6-phosphate deacetylase